MLDQHTRLCVRRHSVADPGSNGSPHERPDTSAHGYSDQPADGCTDATPDRRAHANAHAIAHRSADDAAADHR